MDDTATTIEHEVETPDPQESRAVAAPAAQLPAAETGSAALMRMIEKGAMDPAFDVAKLEKLLAVKKDWERDEARKAFVAAKAAFRAEAPTVGKDKHVSFDARNPDGDSNSNSKSKVEYDHATLGNVAATISPILGKHGLAFSWDVQQKDGLIEVSCILTHALGHSERVTLRAGADNSGKKNAIQQVGSTITYLQRYTLLSITGTATADQDDDGLSAEATVLIDDEQKAELVELLRHESQDTKAFLNHMQIETLDELPAARFPAAKKAIKERIATWQRNQKAKQQGGDHRGKAPADDARERIRGDHR